MSDMADFVNNQGVDEEDDELYKLDLLLGLDTAWLDQYFDETLTVLPDECE